MDMNITEMREAYNALVSQNKKPAVTCVIGNTTKALRVSSIDDIEPKRKTTCELTALSIAAGLKKPIQELRPMCKCKIVNVRESGLPYNPDIDLASPKRRLKK